MTDALANAAAIVGVSAIMPDAPDAAAFWRNVTTGRYSISDVDPERWDPELYYDPDPKAPEKTYSKIGGWVREWEWDPFGWKLPVPPKVADGMDDAHKWAVACTRMALTDAGWPDRPLDLDRTAVIIGNALSGEKHYLTALRIMFPELARELERTASFAELPADVRSTIESELRANFESWLPVITEDTMPGELGNCIAGRVANLFNLHGPNFTTDAACASALAAMDATVDGLLANEFDVAITGGVDRNMGAHTFVKFCAIGALSPSGTRPYSDGADGFVMGEGAALFVVKRLADAIRADDRIYAVVRGVGGASDGKGKGITAPNPVGQRLAVERAWRNAGLSPAECTLIEGHGTSTSVGDAVELNSLTEAFSGAQVAPGSIALGSVKSNIGHLKGAAGAAGMLKATLALHDKVLPPSINFERPNPNLDWTTSPFAVNTELRNWEVAPDRSRVMGVSAFGFGGTNFHLVMEEYMPDGHGANGRPSSVAVPVKPPPANEPPEPVRGGAPPPRPESGPPAPAKPPLRGALVLGAPDEAGLANALRTELAEARQGRHLDPTPPSSEALRAPERIAIDFADGPDLVAKAELASRMLQAGNPSAWPALRGRGIHRGSGPPGKVAFLYTGQGSQYANMLAELRRREPVVADLFEEADSIMTPLLEGRRLSDIIFADPEDQNAIARAEEELRRTEIQQPAVITVDTALTRLLGEYGIAPDLVMGHSVGEYGALVSAGALSFTHALEAVSARGREMASLRVEDPGAMAAVMAPLAEAEEIVAETEGYVVLANINSTHQVVIGGATEAVARAVAAVQERGHTAIPLPVSHGFHTEIVAPASAPLKAMLERLGLQPPELPVVANVTGELYPSGDGAVEQMLDKLSRQVASPVQFVKGLRTLYDEGARIFLEVGPKHALQGFASDVLGDDKVVSLASNHPKQGDVPTFNNALCGLWGAGLGSGRDPIAREAVQLQAGATARPHPRAAREARLRRASGKRVAQASIEPAPAPTDGDTTTPEPVVITGAALGLPGAERLFDDANIARLLNGEQGIDVIPGRLRREMLDKHITRLVKAEGGGASFETIDRLEAVIKLAGRAGAFDPVEEFGVDDDRLAALGRDTQLAIAAGIDTLRDAGIPLVLRYKTTTKGTKLPDRWSLPDELRDETGVIYASAFPGLEEMADEVARYTTDHMRRERMAALESLRARMLDHDGTDPVVLDEVERRIHDLGRELEENAYTFDRRFLFRVLSMGHSQLAELIGARGPNTQINSACASTTQAVALAEDWIRAGRCRRVLIVAADDATSDTMMGWMGAGFLASGAAATDEVVEEAALPFDQRRHGMIIGMGAAGLMVESAAAARERALTPICEVLGSVTANSAFHGTRLDVQHISGVMEELVEQAESRGIDRGEIADETVFISHETYTPARGGSAAAEIHALRDVFGEKADRIVIANVKGFTGHPMGVGLEDVLAVKALETGVVPPVPNFRDPDPELGLLNLSGGGSYPVRYALRLAAGFGSQISLLLLRWTPVADGRRRNVDELGYGYRIADRAAWAAWLRRLSGYEDPELEVSQHRLRVVDQGPPAGIRLEPAPVGDVAPAEIEPAALEDEPAPPAAAEPAEPAAEPPAQEPAPAPAGDDVEARVLAIVAEETGYPPDLLDMDLDLEADLGIDTVKQAEVFATIREAYGIERDDSLQLRDYPTLNHVVAFVNERSGAAPAP
ncbi:MAG TPA: beta-ketoacyl synthase N-terminal-like domain-containing protein, partial [Solirubrobacterales bacterium]|nr:beta-ketoacyl synthase N-terminal-like domain-containing protein [Solirubrobacterales bacterium]